MTILRQDILSVDFGVICHQVNLQGKMGAGLALKIARKWPKVLARYLTADDRPRRLGDLQLTPIAQKPRRTLPPRRHPLWVASLAGQEYLRAPGRKYTDEKALVAAATAAYRFARENRLPIYFPWMIGCGLGGGDWGLVLPNLEINCPKAFLCQWP